MKAAKAVGYYNAGTVEFIYQDGDFFFLEMNTRLQVEHPVTEVITGIDLVEWQIRVASGERLPMTQDEIDALRHGHAIEVRINAENPAGGKFLPSPGTITALRAPDGFGVRFDAGYESGDEISQYYDNLVGKLIVWGKDRPTAIARTIRALEEMVVEGVATTIPADLAILRHPDFHNVTHSTKWVEEVLDLSGIEAPAPPAPSSDDESPLVQRSTTVEVNGKRFAVTMWVPDQPLVAVAGGKAGAKKPARSSSGGGRRRRRQRRRRRPDARDDRQGVGRGRPAGRSRSGGGRARGDEDGEPDPGREVGHGEGDQGRRRSHCRRRRRGRDHRMTSCVGDPGRG